MINPRYRRDYMGEFIVLHTTFRDGQKIQEREWVDNPIVNQHISGRAAIIVSDVDFDRFDYTMLEYHRGGLRGTKRLQTYATGDIWRDLKLNFYVSTQQEQLEAIAATDYGDDTVVYTDRRRVLQFPGQFFLIPYAPMISDPATAMYLAAFDGHQEIFVLGANRELKFVEPKWQQHITEVMRSYYHCMFYFVGVESNMPAEWRSQKNFRCLTHRNFVTHCDV